MDQLEQNLTLMASCRIPGISWDLIAREAQRSAGVEGILNGELHESSRTADAARDLIAASKGTFQERLDWVHLQHHRAVDSGARLVTVLDSDFPKNLRIIVNLPPFFYLLGGIEEADMRSVAVVGTRNASPKGIKKAEKMARLLTEQRVTVVSGLAKGIDTAAHTSALDAGGRTIAVMGTGILNRYPAENARLADRIAEQGALISQFWPDSPPTRKSFPIRNVVTSGVSQGTVVIEASATSGAKMQARLAIEHGKIVFLVESLVMQEKWAQNYAASQGRRVVIVREVEDVIANLRSPQQLEHLTEQQRQLAFDLV